MPISSTRYNPYTKGRAKNALASVEMPLATLLSGVVEWLTDTANSRTRQR